MSIKIRNWHKFQHFKDRKPPWIKLYRDLLDDRSWYELSDSAAKLLISLWLLASEDERQTGELPSLKEIAFRLRLDIRSIKSNISKLSPWLEQDDINAISDNGAISAGYQETRLETERETETYKQEKEVASLPDWLDKEKWEAYVKTRSAKARKPESLNAALEKLSAFRTAGHDPNEIIATSLANGWQGLFEPKPKANGGNGNGDWWATEFGTKSKAQELGVQARPGESMDAFRDRLRMQR